MRVALVSLDQQWEDKPENLRRCEAAVRRAVALGADLAVFPEMTLTGFTMQAAAVAEDPDRSESIGGFARIARAHGVALGFGVVLQSEDRPLNCMVLLARDGHELARYAKIHPFSHAHEHEHYGAGSLLASATIDGVAFGLTICYDLRFAELYAALAPTCDALLVIANWPAPRIRHWHALLAARAIEDQAFVIAVNRTGIDGYGNVYPDSSQVIAPDGERLEPERVDGDVALFTIDARRAAAYRRAFPTLRDRRPDLYARLREEDRVTRSAAR